MTFTNQTKNSISPINTTKVGFYILLEDGGYILQESSFKLLTEAISFGVSMINQAKHAISATNQTKN